MDDQFEESPESVDAALRLPRDANLGRGGLVVSKLPGLHCRDRGDAPPTVLEVKLQAEVQPVKLRLHSEA